MAKITQEMLGKSPSHMKRKRDESVEHYLRRITHLYLAEKNISEIVCIFVNLCASDVI